MSTLEQYQRHLEKFGPERLLETAAKELSENELGQLKAMVDSMQRVSRWHKDQWVYRGQETRQCALAECGLDLPKTASKAMKYHPHCRDRAYRRRRGEKRRANAVGAP
jgi:hypothetical protein